MALEPEVLPVPEVCKQHCRSCKANCDRTSDLKDNEIQLRQDRLHRHEQAGQRRDYGSARSKQRDAAPLGGADPSRHTSREAVVGNGGKRLRQEVVDIHDTDTLRQSPSMLASLSRPRLTWDLSVPSGMFNV